jgi:hypothetical protein
MMIKGTILSTILKRVVVGVLVFVQSAVAQQVKVVKAKGQNAIVQFQRGNVPKEGQTYYLSTQAPDSSFGADDGMGPLGDGSGHGAAAGGRDYKMGLSFFAGKEAGALGPNSAGGTGTFGFGLTVRPGFNLAGLFELGPVLSISRVGAINFMFGGFLEVNFIENRAGAAFVPGLGLQGTFSKGGTISMDGTLFGKIFVLGNSSTCLRVDAGAQMTMLKGASNIGFGLGGGLEAYF